jgi:hypothetical protein
VIKKAEKFGRLAIAGALAVALCSCAQLQARMDSQHPEQIAALDSADDAQCRNYAAPGTPSYVECRNNVKATRDKQQQVYTNMKYVGDARHDNGI